VSQEINGVSHAEKELCDAFVYAYNANSFEPLCPISWGGILAGVRAVRGTLTATVAITDAADTVTDAEIDAAIRAEATPEIGLLPTNRERFRRILQAAKKARAAV
jgi:hypothetical protein